MSLSESHMFEIIQSMLSVHSKMKLEITKRKKFGGFMDMWKWNNIPLNNWWIQEEITKEVGKYFEMIENKNCISRFTECNSISTKREVRTVMSLLKKEERC
jgi:hypothetical protein